MKFSLLTKEAINESFDNILPSLNWGAAIAGETRHYIDWFYGINLSRGLMRALSKEGAFRILSIGRVQGPALKIVYDREMEIESFKPETFWQIFLQIKDIKNQKIEVKYPKDIFNESELLKFKHLKGKKGIAKTEIYEEDVAVPVPFDLTTLQTESYRYYGFTPSQTLKIAQGLYLHGLISYPRTSSQNYPESIGAQKILDRLKKYTQLVKYAVNKKPSRGKKEDPAHPAIYPTGEFKKLNDSEKKIYDLIVKRFISCFCEPAKVEHKKISVDIGGLIFGARGVKIKEKGWIHVYPSSIKEIDVPIIEGEVDVSEIRIEEKQTKPKKRYTAASLIKELEKRDLGTKSTRASIIDTLYSRGYIKEKSIEVTELGKKMVKTLQKYSPIILDEELTREMTRDIENIEFSKEGLNEKEKKILEKAKKEITNIAGDMIKHLEAIGKSLADANEAVWQKEKEENTMSDCYVCHKGKLRIMFGKKYKRYFVSCDAYPKCKTIYSLPPKGLIKPARDKDKNLEMCKECGFPLVLSFQKGRAPWKFCFNPKCPSNKELQKKKEEFKEKLANGEIEIGKDGKVIDRTKPLEKKIRKIRIARKIKAMKKAKNKKYL
jgi:DNA topoisomerase-1